MRKGLPAVIVVTEHFVTLANVVLKSQQVAESVAVIIPPNPESLDDAALGQLAERVLATSIERLVCAKAA